MQTKRDRTIIFIGIFIMTLLIWSNGVKMREMQNQIRQLHNELNNVSQRVSSEVSGIASIVAGIKEQEQWWAPAQVNIEKVEKDEALISVEWHLRDYQENSTIRFHYRQKDSSNFTELAPTEKIPGCFTVTLPVSPPKEPQMYVAINQERDNTLPEPAVTRSEEKSQINPPLTYEYYISTAEKGTIRTSDLLTLNLWEISHRLFNPIEVNISIRKNGNISGSFHERPISKNSPYYEVKKVYLETRSAGNRLQERWQFAENTNQRNLRGVRILQVDAVPEADYHSIYLVVEYNEGLIFEKKIDLPHQ